MATIISCVRARKIAQADKFFKVKFWAVKRAEFGCTEETQIDTMLNVLTLVQEATVAEQENIELDDNEAAFVNFVLNAIEPQSLPEGMTKVDATVGEQLVESVEQAVEGENLKETTVETPEVEQDAE